MKSERAPVGGPFFSWQRYFCRGSGPASGATLSGCSVERQALKLREHLDVGAKGDGAGLDRDVVLHREGHVLFDDGGVGHDDIGGGSRLRDHDGYAHYNSETKRGSG